MAGRFSRSYRFVCVSHTSVRWGLATLLLLTGAGTVHDASAVGDTRTLSFHHTHSGEDLTVTFKRSGRYDDEGLKKLNHFLRDWRSQDSTTMDRHLFDILWEVYRDVDGKQPIQIISAYRSPQTNAMLRRRSSGVARHSQHMLGHAMDFFIPGVPLEQIRFAGLRLQRGGVGFYPTSGSPFVHLDTGSIRHWPRMTRDQLARVFPNGRTVHVPTDGNPLAGYQLALADVQQRKGDDASSFKKPSLLASLFRGKQQADDDEESGAVAASGTAAKPGVIAVAAAKVKEVKEKIAEAVPLPRAKPARAASYQVASAAAPQEVAPPTAVRRQVAQAEPRPQTPADIINARGFWDEHFEEPQQAAPNQQVAGLRARAAAIAADPQATASLPANVSQAMAYAPLLDRTKVVAASAPLPGHVRPASAGANPMSAQVTTIAAKALPGQRSSLATMAKVSATAQMNDTWLRAMILAPNLNSSLRASVLADPDMTTMSAHFIKPVRAVSMTFSSDPQLGLVCERFTGTAVATLSTTSFTRTASLR